MKNEIIRQFKRNTNILIYLVKNLSDDDMLLKTDKSNNIGWIIGHIVLGRGNLLKKLNSEFNTTDSEKIFARYVEKNQDIKTNKKEMLNEFATRGERLAKYISELNEDEFKYPIDFKLPDGGDDLGSYVSFVAWHESFHLGQIDLIKAANGKGGIK